jgi:DNA/RNA non-specific endonuclease
VPPQWKGGTLHWLRPLAACAALAGACRAQVPGPDLAEEWPEERHELTDPPSGGGEADRTEERPEFEQDAVEERDSQAVLDGSAVLGCPAFFELAARGHWHALSGEQYYVDEMGRPSAAETVLPPIVRDEDRDAACQREVGQWGDREGLDDYDGGHLIAYQLGGWGRLVPEVFRLQLTTRAGESVVEEFVNDAAGDASATEARLRVVAWLRAVGCR